MNKKPKSQLKSIVLIAFDLLLLPA